jgi:hypothetical protein
MEGVTFTVESGLPFPDLGYTAPMDPYITDGKAELNKTMHDFMVLYDGLGICSSISSCPTVHDPRGVVELLHRLEGDARGVDGRASGSSTPNA